MSTGGQLSLFPVSQNLPTASHAAGSPPATWPRNWPATANWQFGGPDGLYQAKLDAINPTNVQSLFSAAGTK
jgi:hypothetical protein